jgi:DNA-directed RNA polymerase specialized sigma24 family protein
MDFNNDDQRYPEDSTANGEPPEENLDPVAELPEDDCPGASDEERSQMLRDDILQAKILNVLRTKGVPESAFEDVLQVTLISTVRAPALPGGGGVDRDRYVLYTAACKAIDYVRNADRQVQRDDEADPDAVAPAAPQADLVAERDFLAKVLKASDEQLLRSYKRYKLDEEQLKDIAKDERVPYRRLQKRIAKFEERLRKRARKMLKYGRISGALAALLFALGISRWELEPVPGMMHDDPGPISMLAPDVSTHVTQIDVLDWAAVLRGEALADCMRDDWKSCLIGLNVARDLDPDGDRDPAVQAARSDALTGISAGLKPGPVWHPRGPRPYAPKASR